MLHEFLYTCVNGHGRSFEFYGCKNCQLIIQKPINKNLDEGIFKHLYQDENALEEYIKVQQINFPGFDAEEFRQAVHEINNRTDEEKKLLQQQYDSQQIVECVDILGFPAEGHIISYETGTMLRSWHMESFYFSNDRSSVINASYHSAPCKTCSHYLEKEDICNLKLLPIDYEITDKCQHYKCMFKSIEFASNILTDIIKQSKDK